MVDRGSVLEGFSWRFERALQDLLRPWVMNSRLSKYGSDWSYGLLSENSIRTMGIWSGLVTL